MPETKDEWKEEAVRRWGPYVEQAADVTDWETYVLRLSVTTAKTWRTRVANTKCVAVGVYPRRAWNAKQSFSTK